MEEELQKKLEIFVFEKHKELLGYGLKWQMELVVGIDGSMYSNPFHPNYRTSYNWFEKITKGKKNGEYIHFTFHRNFDPKNIVTWMTKDFLTMTRE